VTDSDDDTPTAPASFDAVLLTSPAAGARVGGLTLLERAAFTAARAGARRLFCIGPAPVRRPRLPAIPVSWTAGGRVALDAASGPVVGLDATTVVDVATLAAFAAAPSPLPRRVEGPGLLWRAPPSLAGTLVQVAPEPHGGTPAHAADRDDALAALVPWTPPRDAMLVHADSPAGREAAGRALYARLARSDEGWFNRTIDRRISRLLTRLLLPTGITPNQVTLASIAVGITAGLLFAGGEPATARLAALLFLFSTIVDGCDGEIARLTFRETRLGAVLDVVGDNVVHLAIFAGIALGSYRRLPSRPTLVVGILLVVGSVVAMVAVVTFIVRRRPTPAQRALFATFASREFAYLLVVLAFIDRLEWFLWLAAVGTGLGASRAAARPAPRA
jgi:phosphatidylglycerophosphate synthase